jgi:NTE family protein
MTSFFHRSWILAMTLVATGAVCTGQTPAIRNLVMEGAGIRGLAYCGAVEELAAMGQLDELERVAGTSAGSIVACLLAVGYSPDEVATIVGETDFGDFNDGQYMFVGGTTRTVRAFGWYKGDAFSEWLAGLVAAKTGTPDLTFEALHALRLSGKPNFELHIAATNLNEQRAEFFSFETHPNMRIVDAVRASMSVPFWFEAVCLDAEGRVVEAGEGDVYIDGGVLTNFPLTLFDDPKYCTSGDCLSADGRNLETLGLRIDDPLQVAADNAGEGLARRDIENVEDYVVALYSLVLEGLNRQALNGNDWNRTISISDTSIGPRVKSLSPEAKSQLLDSGRSAVRSRFTPR